MSEAVAESVWQIADQIREIDRRVSLAWEKSDEVAQEILGEVEGLVAPIASELDKIEELRAKLALKERDLLSPYAERLEEIEKRAEEARLKELTAVGRESKVAVELREKLGKLLEPIVEETGLKTQVGDGVPYDLQLAITPKIEVADRRRAYRTLCDRLDEDEIPDCVDINKTGLEAIGARLRIKTRKAEEINEDIAAKYPGFSYKPTLTPKILAKKVVAVEEQESSDQGETACNTYSVEGEPATPPVKKCEFCGAPAIGSLVELGSDSCAACAEFWTLEPYAKEVA